MTTKHSALAHLARQSDGSVGARGYRSALDLVVGSTRSRVGGFFSDVGDHIESAIKWILFLLATVLVVVVIK